MNRIRLSVIAGLSLLALALPASAQQGAFPNYPIVGGASYCSSTTNGSCTNTVPAGPTGLTGNEQVPANTELSQGQSPQNVLLPTRILNGAGLYSYQLVAAGTADKTLTVPNNVNTIIFDVATGGITAAHVTAPASPMDGQIISISSTKLITTFAFVANTGQTLAVATPTILTPSTTVPQGYKFMYRLTDKKWYRLQ